MPTAPTSPSAAKKIRPYIAWRMPMSRTSPALPRNSFSSRSRLPNSITSSAPATLKRSFIIVFMVALSCIDWRAIAWSLRPTRLAGRTNTGSTTSASRVIFQFSRTMAASVVASPITLDSTEPSVPVSACCAPITSLFMRLTSAPVWLWVKKASGWRCTWSNSAVRRS